MGKIREMKKRNKFKGVLEICREGKGEQGRNAAGGAGQNAFLNPWKVENRMN